MENKQIIEKLSSSHALNALEQMGFKKTDILKEFAFVAGIIPLDAYGKLERVIDTIPQVILQVMSMGLTFNPAMKQVALVTRYDKPSAREVAAFEPMYPALILLAMNTGKFVDISAHAVYQNDVFRINLADNQRPVEHYPETGERGKIVGAYAILTYTNGMRKSEYMHIDDLEKVEAMRPGGEKNRIYEKWRDQMNRKAVLRRLLKMVEKETSKQGLALAEAIYSDEQLFDRDLLEAPKPDAENAQPPSRVQAISAELQKSIDNCEQVEDLTALFDSGAYDAYIPAFTARRLAIRKAEEEQAKIDIEACTTLDDLTDLTMEWDIEKNTRFRPLLTAHATKIEQNANE